MKEEFKTLVFNSITYDKYLISNLGNVIGPSGKILKTQITSGYLGFTYGGGSIKKRRIQIARAVLQTFNSVDDTSLVVNHINGIKTDNRLSNLEWETLSGNANHAIRIGLKDLDKNKGTSNTKSKLTIEDLNLITNLHKQGLSHRQIAKQLNVTHGTIGSYLRGKSYQNIL